MSNTPIKATVRLEAIKEAVELHGSFLYADRAGREGTVVIAVLVPVDEHSTAAFRKLGVKPLKN